MLQFKQYLTIKNCGYITKIKTTKSIQYKYRKKQLFNVNIHVYLYKLIS